MTTAHNLWRSLLDAKAAVAAEINGAKLGSTLGRILVGNQRRRVRQEFPALSPKCRGKLERRAALAQTIAANAEGGEVGIYIHDGDCDGVRAGRPYVLPAQPFAVERFIDQREDWAEVYFSVEIIPPSEAREADSYWRDTFAEAAGY
jgi:hypothetical protein